MRCKQMNQELKRTSFPVVGAKAIEAHLIPPIPRPEIAVMLVSFVVGEITRTESEFVGAQYWKMKIRVIAILQNK